MSNLKIAVFGGGCFWCTEAVFSRLKGVIRVLPGYTGGKIKNPSYREVCSGLTGHNEVVEIQFDTDQISYSQLLEVFFSTHDPTTLNRQGNDVGSQYRSGIYYTDEEQKIEVTDFIQKELASLWRDPVVTEVMPLEVFYPAEEYHHNYFARNPEQGYCQIIIKPKLTKLRTIYSKLLKNEH
jgi:methionine-S-sulfoxide reductase